MHRLRKQKKSPKGEEDESPPVPPVSKGGFFSREKPEPVLPEPPKTPLLEDALPSSDDFRTSLLMPNLANRFSILKAEQDALAAAAAAGTDSGGPGAESVAVPRFAGLGDIAETASLNGSITARADDRRPSEDQGSVMTRGRQGEGNVLFGGRQKVYKVAPTRGLRTGTSMEELHTGSGFGRAVGSNELAPDWKSRDDDAEGRNDDLGEQNRKRYTSSSTNSTPTTMTRTSTAATSFTSQPSASVSSSSLPQSPTMATGKPRRPLYEQALDQQLQDQQSSSVGRLEHLASLRRASASPPLCASPRILSPRESLSPVSPTSRSAMPWETMKSPDTIAEEAKDSQQKSDNLPKPSAFDTFDFGLNTPISPPLTVRDESPVQGLFSPDTGNQGPQHGHGRPESPVSQRSRHGRTSSDIEAHSTFFASSSERSSFENGSAVQQARDSNDSDRRLLDVHSNTKKSAIIRVSSYLDSESEPASRPGSPRSMVSRPSSDQNEPARNFFTPVKNLEVSPNSRKFADAQPSPTLPPGGGLSLLVRQHLRSESDASSMYAGSTYTKVSRVSRYGVAASIIKVGAEIGATGSSAWQYEDLHPDDYDDAMSPENTYQIPAFPASPPSKHSVPIRSSEEEERRGRRRAESRAGSVRGDSSSRPGTRAPSRAGTERSLSRAGDRDSVDWEQQLAFRRQIVQQNLRNQEKIASQQEEPQTKGGALGALKSKGKTDVGRSPIIPRAESRDRSANGRPEIRHQTGAQRPPLITHHTFGGNGRSADPMSPSTRSTRSRNSPPRVRRNPSHEQMNGKGTPMGWQDDFGSPPPPQARSTPGTPNPRQGPLPPLPGGRTAGFKDDLSRAMMTGQSKITDIPAQEQRRNNGLEEPLENVKSTFEDDERRPTFRRTRGNSLLRQKTPTTAQLPPLNTTALAPPIQVGTPGSATSAASSVRSSVVVQQIAAANSALTPARKRMVNKFEIGEPTLITKTSQIPLVDLPARDTSELASSAASIKTTSASIKSSRKRTNTLFAAFSRHASHEEIPPVPSTPKAGNKLRKCTSDGGTLHSRARVDEAALMREQMPKINPAFEKEVNGGMI